MDIFYQALIWHFWETPKEIVKAWKTLLVFNFNYFSVATLLKTFFSPWRRYQSAYGGWGFQKNIETLIFNSMSRIIGAILRATFIILGGLFMVIILICGIFLLALWVLLPFLAILGVWKGIEIMF
jgi:hypothetical protein